MNMYIIVLTCFLYLDNHLAKDLVVFARIFGILNNNYIIKSVFKIFVFFINFKDKIKIIKKIIF